MDAKVMKRAVVVLLCLLARCPANHRMGEPNVGIVSIMNI